MTGRATATEYNHWPSRILGRVQRGETVTVEKFGQATATMIPEPGRTSGAELARKLRAMSPQPETARALASLLEQLNESP